MKRSVHLRLIGGGSVEVREGVPRSRAECPTTRPCGHVHCRFHLWFVEGRDRRGRRVDGRTPDATMWPAWRAWPTPPSCAIDVAEAGRAVEETAAAIGLRPSQFRAVVAGALKKLGIAGKSLREFADEAG